MLANAQPCTRQSTATTELLMKNNDLPLSAQLEFANKKPTKGENNGNKIFTILVFQLLWIL